MKKFRLHVQERYNEEAAKPVHFDVNSLYELGLEVIHGEIVCFENGVIRHDTKKVAKILYSLLLDETKQQTSNVVIVIAFEIRYKI